MRQWAVSSFGPLPCWHSLCLWLVLHLFYFHPENTWRAVPHILSPKRLSDEMCHLWTWENFDRANVVNFAFHPLSYFYGWNVKSSRGVCKWSNASGESSLSGSFLSLVSAIFILEYGQSRRGHRGFESESDSDSPTAHSMNVQTDRQVSKNVMLYGIWGWGRLIWDVGSVKRE